MSEVNRGKNERADELVKQGSEVDEAGHGGIVAKRSKGKQAKNIRGKYVCCVFSCSFERFRMLKKEMDTWKYVLKILENIEWLNLLQAERL